MTITSDDVISLIFALKTTYLSNKICMYHNVRRKEKKIRSRSKRVSTLFINGCQFKILLYAFKLASLNLFGSNNIFWIINSKTRSVRLVLILTKEFIIGSHLWKGSMKDFWKKLTHASLNKYVVYANQWRNSNWKSYLLNASYNFLPD